MEPTSVVEESLDLGKFALQVRELSHCWQDDMILPAFA